MFEVCRKALHRLMIVECIEAFVANKATGARPRIRLPSFKLLTALL